MTDDWCNVTGETFQQPSWYWIKLHDLAGVLFSSLTISLSVAGSNELRGGDWRAVMTGGYDAVTGNC